MFWINKGPKILMTIEKAGMDGFLRTSLVAVTAQSPRGLTLDVAARRLYWLSDFKKVGAFYLIKSIVSLGKMRIH